MLNMNKILVHDYHIFHMLFKQFIIIFLIYFNRLKIALEYLKIQMQKIMLWFLIKMHIVKNVVKNTQINGVNRAKYAP